jgi:hypothetical protein
MHPTLRAAVDDLCWLLSRGYAHESSLKLVGDRHGLVARQRIAVCRSACSEADARRRQEHCVAPEATAGRALWLDGYNVLTTIEAALAGGILLAARDGAYRDMASMHGSYRKVEETLPALNLLGEMLSRWGVCEAVWLLDRPVSNSGRLRGLMEELAAAKGWPWRVELEPSPDHRLIETPEIVVTADSVILDRCRAWVNLARETILEHVPQARVVELT